MRHPNEGGYRQRKGVSPARLRSYAHLFRYGLTRERFHPDDADLLPIKVDVVP